MDSAPYVPRSIVINPFFGWGHDRPPATPYHDTVIYEAHVRGLTISHPKIPEHLRGTYAALGHPEILDHLTKLGVTALELMPVHQFVTDHILEERGLANYWGYNSHRLLRPAQPLLQPGAARRAGAGVQGDGPGAARGGHRGHPRRGLQPHRRGQPPGADAGPAGHRQPGLLPAGRRRQALLHGHHGHRQQPAHALPARAPDDHGLAALLGHRDARRRLPLRPGLDPGARAARGRPAERVLRPGPAGPGAVAGQAHRRAVGRRAGRLPGGQLPVAVDRVERPLPRHHPRPVARPAGHDARVRLPASPAPATSTRTTAAAPPPRSTSSPATTASPCRISSRTTTSTTRRTRRTTATAPTTTGPGTAARKARRTGPPSRCASSRSATS